MWEASSTDQILPMVAYDLGIGINPEALARDALQRGEVYRNQLTDPLPDRTFCAVVDQSRSLSTAAETLLQEFVKLRH